LEHNRREVCSVKHSSSVVPRPKQKGRANAERRPEARHPTVKDNRGSKGGGKAGVKAGGKDGLREDQRQRLEAWIEDWSRARMVSLSAEIWHG